MRHFWGIVWLIAMLLTLPLHLFLFPLAKVAGYAYPRTFKPESSTPPLKAGESTND